MLDIQQLRKDLPAVVAALKRRGFDLDEAAFRALEDERKKIQLRTEELQSKSKTLSKQIGMLKGKGEDASDAMREAAAIPDDLKANEAKLADIQARLDEFLRRIPNVPRPEVPQGKSEHDNVDWRVEEQAATPHPAQQPVPAERRIFDVHNE